MLNNFKMQVPTKKIAKVRRILRSLGYDVSDLMWAFSGNSGCVYIYNDIINSTHVRLFDSSNEKYIFSLLPHIEISMDDLGKLDIDKEKMSVTRRRKTN